MAVLVPDPHTAPKGRHTRLNQYVHYKKWIVIRTYMTEQSGRYGKRKTVALCPVPRIGMAGD
jgi:hypothetical protein